MSVDLNSVAEWGELDDWLECPACGSTDCRIDQDPDHIYLFCNECDHYADAELKWLP